MIICSIVSREYNKFGCLLSNFLFSDCGQLSYYILLRFVRIIQLGKMVSIVLHCWLVWKLQEALHRCSEESSKYFNLGESVCEDVEYRVY